MNLMLCWAQIMNEAVSLHLHYRDFNTTTIWSMLCSALVLSSLWGFYLDFSLNIEAIHLRIPYKSLSQVSCHIFAGRLSDNKQVASGLILESCWSPVLMLLNNFLDSSNSQHITDKLKIGHLLENHWIHLVIISLESSRFRLTLGIFVLSLIIY